MCVFMRKSWVGCLKVSLLINPATTQGVNEYNVGLHRLAVRDDVSILIWHLDYGHVVACVYTR